MQHSVSLAVAPLRRVGIPERALVLFIISYGLLLYHYGWQAGIFTLGVGLVAGVVAIAFRLSRNTAHWRSALAYGLFFLTPALTLSGQIGVLTGFGGSSASLPWLGVAFISTALALQVARNEIRWQTLFQILQPLRFNSGPCALTAPTGTGTVRRLTFRRVVSYSGWFVLGGFFYSVIASGIAPLLVLRNSTDALDILAFAILFEAYVYFNFSGISFMVYGALKMAGVPVIRNFNSPFAAKDLIGYWQRWHISLSTILKGLFFNPLRATAGLSIAVTATFLFSALWHGVSLNFLLWGIFHAIGWLSTRALGNVLPTKAGVILKATIFPVVVVLGRLMFSEADSQTLLLKLRNLFAWTSSENAWLLNLSLDTKTEVILAGALAWVLTEIFSNRKKYTLLRKPWVTTILIVLCAFFGSSGLGGVYGAR